jgi:iduronate 2-sulfatase
MIAARFFILIFILSCLSAQILEAADKPNVLMICVDDLKPNLGCYGDKFAHTPNIDALAASGILFESAYCNQAVCSPSRNSLMLGLRPQTIGIYDLPTHFRLAVPDAITLPQYFKSHGYHTAGLGKILHVGHGNIDDVDSWSVPSYRGNGNYANKQTLDKLKADNIKIKSSVNKNLNDKAKGPATENEDVPDETYADGQVAEEAIKRLQAAATTPNQPFFLAVGFIKPHLPFVAPQKYWAKYDPSLIKLPGINSPPKNAPDFAPTSWGELRSYSDIPQQGALSNEHTRHLIHGYYAATSYMDTQLGKVLSALKTTGLDKNTIVFLWGDHGWHLGDHGMWCKHTNYEQAARIPLILSWPDKIPAGTTSKSLTETVDIFPTIAELAGLPLPQNIDGESFVKTLKNPHENSAAFVYHVYPREGMLGRAIRTERYRLVEWKKPGAEPSTAIFELYDYKTDPLETVNLANSQKNVVEELLPLLHTQPEAKPQFAKQPNKNANTSKKPAKSKSF